MTIGRLVAFRIYHGERSVVQGQFFVVPQEGVSCFGEYQAIGLPGNVVAPMYEGVVIRHNLEPDGGVLMEVDLYAVDNSDSVPKQYRVLRSGISMGCDAGEAESESVMLGNTHEFVYQTRMVS